MLLNMLIAMMAKTFDVVYDQMKGYHCFLLSQLYVTWSKSPQEFASPFDLLQWFGYIVDYLGVRQNNLRADDVKLEYHGKDPPPNRKEHSDLSKLLTDNPDLTCRKKIKKLEEKVSKYEGIGKRKDDRKPRMVLKSTKSMRFKSAHLTIPELKEMHVALDGDYVKILAADKQTSYYFVPKMCEKRKDDLAPYDHRSRLRSRVSLGSGHV